jgi:DNA-binding CsgD family transcriptional regulator/tetratricopeptide (TPR) repeat protein
MYGPDSEGSEGVGKTGDGAEAFAGSAVSRAWPLVARDEELDTVLRALGGQHTAGHPGHAGPGHPNHTNPATQPPDHEPAGAVVTGEAGIGKTALARALAQRLARTHHLVALRGTNLASRIPYGALGHLLVDLPDSALDSPVTVALELARNLQHDARGKPVAILVDNAGQVDPQGTAVLIQLVFSGAARVVVFGRRAKDIPEDFQRLARDGRLVPVELPPLTEEGVAATLRTQLRGTVAPSVVAALHSLTEGNPLYLQRLVAEQLASGNLFLDRCPDRYEKNDDGVWALRGPLTVSGSAAQELIHARVARYGPALAEILELVALSEGIPLRQLVALYDPEDISTLEDEGMLEIALTADPMVVFRNRFVAETVRANVSVIRSRALRRKLAPGGPGEAAPGHGAPAAHGHAAPETAGPYAHPEGVKGSQLLAFAAWTQACGDRLTPATALAAAKEANRLLDPLLALRVATDIRPQDPEWTDGQLATARAHLIQEDPEAAMAALDAIGPERLAALDGEEFLEYATARTAVLHAIDGRSDEVPELFAEARARIEPIGPSPAGVDEAAWHGKYDAGPHPDTVRHLLKLVALRELEHHAFIGNYRDIVRPLQELLQELPDRDTLPAGGRDTLAASVVGAGTADPAGPAAPTNTPHRPPHAAHTPDEREFRFAATALLCEALAVTGRQHDALTLLQEVLAQLPDPELGAPVRNTAMSRLFKCLLLGGLLNRCRVLVQQAIESMPARLPSQRGGLELILGLVYVLQGYPQDALHYLRLAIAQLRQRATAANLGMAYAAAALAHAEMDEKDAACEYLELTAGRTDAGSWFTRSVTEYCKMSARLHTGDLDMIPLLRETAEEDLRSGRYVPAEMRLSLAALWEDPAALARLEEITAGAQGVLSRALHNYARGWRQQDMGLLLHAADLAAEAGGDALEYMFCAQAARLSDLAGESGAGESGTGESGAAAPDEPHHNGRPGHNGHPPGFNAHQMLWHRVAEDTGPQPRLNPGGSPGGRGTQLSARERQVAMLAAAGLSNKEIAGRIGKSVRTVEGHLYQIYAKLNITARSQLKQFM